MGKLGPDTPNHELGHMKNNSKCSIPRFILKEALLNWQSLLRIEFGLFYGFLSIARIEETVLVTTCLAG